MIRALMQKLGLDRISDVVADEAKRVQVDVLREEREVLARMIAKLDERISALGAKRRDRPPKAVPATAAIAAPPTPTRRPPRRWRLVHAPGETLRDMVAKALTNARAPIKVATIVGLVKQLGYRTTAKPSTLLTSIYHVLADKKLFRKMGNGAFGLPVAPTTAGKAMKQAISPKAPEPKRRGRKRGTTAIAAAPSEALQVLVLRTFRQTQRPMKASEIAKRIKRLGNRSRSTPESLLFSVEHVLEDEELFRRVGKDRYELALPGTTKVRVGRPRNSAKAREKRPAHTAAEARKASSIEKQTSEVAEVQPG